MKKLFLSLSLSCAAVCAFAQTPTWNFEGWTGSGPVIEPIGWVSGNVLTMIPGNKQSVFQAIAPDIHGGTYAMKIVTVDVVINPDPTTTPDPIGFVATGSFSGVTLKGGFPYTVRPASAELWYKYAPSGVDTASFFMWLTKWNATTVSRDTIAWGYWKTSATVSAFTNTGPLTLVYNAAFPTTLPDTAGVIFSATGSGCLTCGNIGSTLWVDDITFSGWNGINEHPSSNGVIVFPNPANEYVTIIADVYDASSVIAYDVTGKIISSTALKQTMSGISRKEGVINTSTFSAGLYSYAVFDARGNTLRNGKFNVVR